MSILYANNAVAAEISIKELFDTRQKPVPAVEKSISVSAVAKKQALVEKTYSEVIEVSCSSKMPKVPNTLVRDSAKEVVIDSKFNLMWQDNSDVKTVEKDWNGAIDHCQNLSFAGYSDWRLPRIDELLSITDDTRHNPAIDNNFNAENIDMDGYPFYWSSSSRAKNEKEAWFVNFIDGGDAYAYGDSFNKLDALYVRCVRDNQ